jgi:tRNA A-37 threonylcarbamoyl transferase component Bud32
MKDPSPATPFSSVTADPIWTRRPDYDGDTVVYASSAAPAPQKEAEEALAFLAPDDRGGLGRLGPYRLLQVLGRGGMGIVFRAEDTALCRQVALKVMRPSVARKAVARERFLREARATSQIEHDHIVTTYHVGEDRGVPYMAMQLLRGGSLDTWLAQGNRPTVWQAVRIVREAALGLAAAHARGLIHRDVKPSNLWLENRAAEPAPDETARALMPVRVKLLDFGLARAVNDNSNLTRVGAIVGTPTYMSPEQACGRDIDDRSDLFSLGCVLYRLCTGVLPFHGEDAEAIFQAIIGHTPAPAHALNPDVPAQLDDLIGRMLAKDPTQRPPSARTVAEELQALERDLGGRARTVASPAPASKLPAALQWQSWPARLRVTVAAVMGGALVLFLAMIAFALMPSSGTVVIRAADDAARGAVAKSALAAIDQRTGESRPLALGAQSLRPGRYSIDRASVPPGMRFEPSAFEVSSRGVVAVVVHVDGCRPGDPNR